MGVHPIIRELLNSEEVDLLPTADTSSHWQRHGNSTEAILSEDDLKLSGVGFGDFEAGSLERISSFFGRWPYRKVISGIKAYAEVQRAARLLASGLGLGFTFDAWRNAVLLAVLKDHWDAHKTCPKTFAMIGDGYGFCGALIRRVVPRARLLLIDLPKIMVFQVRTLQRSDPDAKMGLLSESQDVDVMFARPSEIESYSSDIDCAINMASMGEMTHESIIQYFGFLRKRSRVGSRFYCVNRESKSHPDGTVIRFDHYPWKEADETYLDGICPYSTHYWSSRVSGTGPRIAGFHIPFLQRFDGPFRHRLVRLASE
jgi:hypothetical protein